MPSGGVLCLVTESQKQEYFRGMGNQWASKKSKSRWRLAKLPEIPKLQIKHAKTWPKSLSHEHHLNIIWTWFEHSWSVSISAFVSCRRISAVSSLQNWVWTAMIHRILQAIRLSPAMPSCAIQILQIASRINHPLPIRASFSSLLAKGRIQPSLGYAGNLQKLALALKPRLASCQDHSPKPSWICSAACTFVRICRFPDIFWCFLVSAWYQLWTDYERAWSSMVWTSGLQIAAPIIRSKTSPRGSCLSSVFALKIISHLRIRCVRMCNFPQALQSGGRRPEIDERLMNTAVQRLYNLKVWELCWFCCYSLEART